MCVNCISRVRRCSSLWLVIVRSEASACVSLDNQRYPSARAKKYTFVHFWPYIGHLWANSKNFSTKRKVFYSQEFRSSWEKSRALITNHDHLLALKICIWCLILIMSPNEQIQQTTWNSPLTVHYSFFNGLLLPFKESPVHRWRHISPRRCLRYWTCRLTS